MSSLKKNLFSIIYILFIVSSCTIDFTKKETNNEEIYGKVIYKYRDELNHMEPTIIFENNNENYTYQVSDWAINSDLWDYLQIGDSVIKPSGTLILRVKKEDGSYKDYEYQR